jgi:hypothetical protein
MRSRALKSGDHSHTLAQTSAIRAASADVASDASWLPTFANKYFSHFVAPTRLEPEFDRDQMALAPARPAPTAENRIDVAFVEALQSSPLRDALAAKVKAFADRIEVGGIKCRHDHHRSGKAVLYWRLHLKKVLTNLAVVRSFLMYSKTLLFV